MTTSSPAAPSPAFTSRERCGPSGSTTPLPLVRPGSTGMRSTELRYTGVFAWAAAWTPRPVGALAPEPFADRVTGVLEEGVAEGTTLAVAAWAAVCAAGVRFAEGVAEAGEAARAPAGVADTDEAEALASAEAAAWLPLAAGAAGAESASAFAICATVVHWPLRPLYRISRKGAGSAALFAAGFKTRSGFRSRVSACSSTRQRS